MTFRARAVVGSVLGGAGAVAVAAALLTDAASPASSPAEDPSVSPAAATAGAPFTEPAEAHAAWTPGDLAEMWARLPAELRGDLAAVRTEPAAERPAALEQIRDDALAGGYGAQVQAGAERLVARLALLPPELVTDLGSLASLELAAMPDAVERMRDRALTGGYGEQVRAGVQRLVVKAGQHRVDVRGDLDGYLPSSWG